MDDRHTSDIIYFFQLKRICLNQSLKVLEGWPIQLGWKYGLRKWMLQALKMWEGA